MLQIQAYVPTHTYGGEPISAAELKRMPAYPKSLGATVARLRKLPHTVENTKLLGDAICAAVNAQIKGNMSRALEADHVARKDWQVTRAYQAAMAGTPVRGLVKHITEEE